MIRKIEITPIDHDDDLEFWLSKTPEERIEAIEYFRQQYIDYLKSQNQDVPEGLQRVYQITPRQQD